MKASVIVFPGSNCDRDAAVALEAATGKAPAMVWHGDAELPKSDLIVLPGGFSYGDYLRSGAMAAHSPVMREVVKRAQRRHARARHLQRLPGADRGGAAAGRAHAQFHRSNSSARTCISASSGPTRVYTQGYAKGEVVTFPIAHKDGSYFADEETLDRLEGEGLVAFRYCDAEGAVTRGRQSQRLGAQHRRHL